MPTYLSPGVYVEEVELREQADRGRGHRHRGVHRHGAEGTGEPAHPGDQLAPVRREVRRHHRRRVPRPRRVRLLPQRWRQLLRRARRRPTNGDGDASRSSSAQRPHRRPRGPRARAGSRRQRHDDRGLRPARGLARGHGAHRRSARGDVREEHEAAPAVGSRQRRQHAQPLAARPRRARPASRPARGPAAGPDER